MYFRMFFMFIFPFGVIPDHNLFDRQINDIIVQLSQFGHSVVGLDIQLVRTAMQFVNGIFRSDMQPFAYKIRTKSNNLIQKNKYHECNTLKLKKIKKKNNKFS